MAPIHYQTLSYDRQTLTSPSDSVLCLIGIQHVILQSDTRNCPMTKPKFVFSNSNWSDQTLSGFSDDDIERLPQFSKDYRSVHVLMWVTGARTRFVDITSGGMQRNGRVSVNTESSVFQYEFRLYHIVLVLFKWPDSCHSVKKKKKKTQCANNLQSKQPTAKVSDRKRAHLFCPPF